MNLRDLLAKHLSLCDKLYTLCLEENRILKQEGRAPDPAWLERKRELANQFNLSLADLKARELSPGERGGDILEQARQRSLQILHIDKENEQLLLRCSLGPAKPNAPAVSTQTAARAYGRK